MDVRSLFRVGGRADANVARGWRRTPFLTRVLLGLQLILIPGLVEPAWMKIDGNLLLRLLLTIISLRCAGLLIAFLTPNLPGIRSLVPLAVVLIYLMLGFYHQQTSIPFGLDLVGDHYREWLAPGALAVIADRLAPWQWCVCGLVYFGGVLLETQRGVFAADVRTKLGWTGALICAGLYALLAVLPVSSFDELNLLLRGVHRKPRVDVVDQGGPHPCVTWREADGRFDKGQERPHVFLLMLESFNSGFVEASSEAGREYTPYFNSLVPKGVYVERFYGNSVNTVKGQAATLGSVPPTLRGSLARDYPLVRLRGLPQVLREHGYDTWFVQAAPDLAFHDTGSFMRRLGFDKVTAMRPESLPASERAHIWGWGLQDDRFYRRVFELLDNAHAAPGGRRPRFVTLATVSGHSPFDQLPADQRRIHVQPRTKREHYANTIHAVDGYLREFFAQLSSRPHLANSVIIVVGDHGHPLGEHGHYATEVGAYEENFRTPFLLLWEGQVQPRRIKDRAYSQLDVAPTLVDLLDLGGWHHFQGRSILAEPDPDQAALLVQPYGGPLVGVVRYPYKYVLHVSRQEERLFNLDHDPAESLNLSFKELDQIVDLRRHAARLLLNQKLIEENRIWPQEGRGRSP